MATLSSLTGNTLSYNIATASKLDNMIKLGSSVSLKYSKLCYKRLTDNDQKSCYHNGLSLYLVLLIIVFKRAGQAAYFFSILPNYT